MKKTNDNRSQDFIFLPFCAMAQAFHAEGLVKYEWKGVIKPLLNTIIDNDINIIQMPCPESMFHSLNESLLRKPQGYKSYNNDAFRSHCSQLAKDVAYQIETLIQKKYNVIGVIGIQFSPSCAIDLQYTNRGNIKLAGIFIQELQKELDKRSIDIPLLGINRRGIKSSIKRLMTLIEKRKTSLTTK